MNSHLRPCRRPLLPQWLPKEYVGHEKICEHFTAPRVRAVAAAAEVLQTMCSWFRMRTFIMAVCAALCVSCGGESDSDRPERRHAARDSSIWRGEASPLLREYDAAGDSGRVELIRQQDASGKVDLYLEYRALYRPPLRSDGHLFAPFAEEVVPEVLARLESGKYEDVQVMVLLMEFLEELHREGAFDIRQRSGPVSVAHALDVSGR